MPHFPFEGKWVCGMTQERCVWAVKIDERGRITMPKDLLELLGFKPDDIVVFVREDEGPICVGKGQFQVEIPFAQKPMEKGAVEGTQKE
jgi:AbrB family looped-hinge helix DNA binding protein